MNIWNASKVMDRLNQMVDNAIEGKPVENGFDETRMSALETKLSQYLSMNSAAKTQLGEEKAKINQMISDISHQTKTPIANILLYTQLLSESRLSRQDKECVGFLAEQAEKLSFLVSSLVKISRLEAGIITVCPKLNQINGLLEGVVNEAGQKAVKKDILLTLENTEIYGTFDPKWTAEAVYNIIDNAIKYTPEGGSIRVSAVKYQLFCRIDVQDTGIGISEDEIPKIFTRFYRSGEVNQEEGVGIGLYLAREIIAGQGGYIKVFSKPGRGSLFSVFLPAGSEIFQN